MADKAIPTSATCYHERDKSGRWWVIWSGDFSQDESGRMEHPESWALEEAYKAEIYIKRGSMKCHKIYKENCLSVATEIEEIRLRYILDLPLYKVLAERWCDLNGYKLGGYLGDLHWGSTS
uniref:Uncharacterized protein n=1 Tax=viral metagenome TaxID=1070528 RepID=A0A6M3LUC2_9ZZZZ